MYKNNVQPSFITNEDLITKLGYKKAWDEKDRGLSVNAIRHNKRETILSVSSSPKYGISWLQKQLDKVFFKGKNNGKNKR